MPPPPIEPEGDLVSSPPALHPNTITQLTGQHLTLVPLTLSHIPSLYLNLGQPSQAHIWRYIPNGPFDSLESFTAALVFMIDSDLFFPFALLSSDSVHVSNQSPNHTRGTPSAISMINYMTISPSNLSLEIGAVLFTPSLQRTTAATEIYHLLLTWAFEVGGYQRVEWKANSLNEPSKRAALRLGFKAEGVFRKHIVAKGRRRDTAWFSMLDDEWFEGGKGCKLAFEKWLGEENFVDGRQVRRLEEFRA